jgi:hypothetical protein
MRPLITSLILTFQFTIAFGQSETSQTNIIIIGTIHNGNKLFNHNTLFEVLKENKPDIILWEQSIKFKRVVGLRTAKFLKIWKPGIEQLSLQKYTAIYKDLPVLPFDTNFKSKKTYLKNRIAIKQSFHDNLYSAKKTISDSTIYADFATKHDFYYSFTDTSSLGRINRKDIIDKGRELYYLEEKVILPLGKKYISDTLLVNNFSNEVQFWNERNDYMVNQILNYSKQFKGKKIIILTGLAHKYYLQDKLSELNLSNLKFIEFTSE